MEQLEGCDDATKAFVRAMMKDKADGYMTRYFQQQMVGGLSTIATDAVTTCRTYTKLLEVCNKIKDVLESNDIDAEQKNERILALLSTINEDSEWNSPYDSDRPDYKSWTEMTKNHLLHTFELAQKKFLESPNSNLVFFMEAKYFEHVSDEILDEYFTTPPISLFDKNPHNFSARLYRVKVGQVVIDDKAQEQYINMIVMDCSFFTPYAIQSSSSATTRIKSSASLVAVTHVLVEAGIVSSEVLSKMHRLNLAFGIGVEGRFTHGTVSNPAGKVSQACQLIFPRNYGVNQYEPGVEEIATEFMRSSGNNHSLDSRKLHKLYAVAIVQILGVELVENWLRIIHNNTVSLSDPNKFLQSMQQQGIENARERFRVKRKLKRQKDSANLVILEQLEVAGDVLNDKQRVQLKVLRSARERYGAHRLRENEARRLRRQKAKLAKLDTLKQIDADGGVLYIAKLEDQQSAKKRKSEYDRSIRQAKRPKNEEAAGLETHPMIELLLANSGGKKCSSKLIQLISNGTVKNVLTSYFVHGQKMKLYKFLKTVDGREKLSLDLLKYCFVGPMSVLMHMEHGIRSKRPLRWEQSIHAQQIIIQLFPEHEPSAMARTEALQSIAPHYGVQQPHQQQYPPNHTMQTHGNYVGWPMLPSHQQQFPQHTIQPAVYNVGCGGTHQQLQPPPHYHQNMQRRVFNDGDGGAGAFGPAVNMVHNNNNLYPRNNMHPPPPRTVYSPH
jgi:hypothetical protein